MDACLIKVIAKKADLSNLNFRTLVYLCPTLDARQKCYVKEWKRKFTVGGGGGGEESTRALLCDRKLTHTFHSYLFY